MVRPFSIALVYGGDVALGYAKVMEKVISEDIASFPFVSKLVDGADGDLWEYIEQTFNDVEYAIVFFSEVYRGVKKAKEKTENTCCQENEKSITMTTPNLMLEFGYLLHKIGKDNIKIVTDFKYDRVEDGSFIFPSDVRGNSVKALPELKIGNQQEEAFHNLWEDIKQRLKDREVIGKYIEADKLLTKEYIPNMKSIFDKEMRMKINEYSLDKQYLKVWDNWIEELKEIQRLEVLKSKAEVAGAYKVVFLFERALWLFMYKDYKRDGNTSIGIENFDCSNTEVGINEDYIRLYREIRDYIFKSSEWNKSEYELRGKKIVDYINGLDIIASFIGVLSLNYAGLCFLNASGKEEPKKIDLLKKAKECFIIVIENSRNFEANGSVDSEILCAYAKFNLARAMAWAGDSYEKYSTMYKQAIVARKNLSQNSAFPEFVQLYWKREAFHAENSRISECCTYWKNNQMIKEIKGARKTLDEIEFELKALETTKVAQQPFFSGIKENAKKNRKLLKPD